MQKLILHDYKCLRTKTKTPTGFCTFGFHTVSKNNINHKIRYAGYCWLLTLKYGTV